MSDQIELGLDNPTEKEESFNPGDYQYVYEYNVQKGTIDLMKSEIPAEINNYFAGLGMQNGVVKPNWDPYELEWLAIRNHTHRRCIEIKATLISGFGYDIRNKKHANYEKLKEFLKRPNAIFGDTFSKISMNVLRAKNTYGAGGVFINKALDIVQMFASTNMKSIFVVPEVVRGERTTKIKKFYQVSRDGNRKVEFFPYDGNPKVGRNYLYRFGYKTFSNSYYPEPEYIAVKDKIFEDLFVDQNNIDFFKNRARMDIILIFTGGKLGVKDKEEIKDKYREELKVFKGLGNQHKTMVLEAAKGADIKVHDLSKNEDGQYSQRQLTLEYSIARSHGIMPALLLLMKGGSGMGGGSVAVGDLFLQNQIMIRPEQRDYEEDWNLVLESLFKFDPQIKFRTIDTNNQKDMAIILVQLCNLGIISKEDAKKYIVEHGLMEIDIDKIIEEKDLVKPFKQQVNATGDSRTGTNTDDKPDEATAIDENKFDE